MQACQMANPEIVNKVIKIAGEQLSVVESEITAQSNFAVDLRADSLAITEFVLALEEVFEIDIADEKLRSMATIEQAAEVVEELLKAKA